MVPSGITPNERGGKLLVFFCKSTDMSVKKAGDRIDLSGDDAIQFEEILRSQGDA